MSKTYRFYFTLGSPIYDLSGNLITRTFNKSRKNVLAHSLQDAIERLTKPMIAKYGKDARLYLEQGFVSNGCSPRVSHREDWEELNMDAAYLAEIVTGEQLKQLISNP